MSIGVDIVRYSTVCETSVEAYRQYLEVKRSELELIRNGCFNTFVNRGWACGVQCYDGDERERVASVHDAGESESDGLVGALRLDREVFADRDREGVREDDGSALLSGCQGVGGRLAQSTCTGVRVSDRVEDKGVESSVDGAGKNTLRNRQWRLEKKEKKKKKKMVQSRAARSSDWRKKDDESSTYTGYFSGLSDAVRDELRDSRAVRYAAENRLKQARAERSLELLLATDVETLKNMNRTKIMRKTEVNKVQVERAFASLSASDNSSGCAKTVSVATLKSGSISPNSSVSAAEVHAMQKELLNYREKESLFKKSYPDAYASVYIEVDGTVDTSFTADTDGCERANWGGYIMGEDGRYRSGGLFPMY